MVVPYPKGGKIVCTCVEDDVIYEKEEYKSIGLHGFDYTFSEEEEGGGMRNGIYGYTYLNHLIYLWTGDL